MFQLLKIIDSAVDTINNSTNNHQSQILSNNFQPIQSSTSMIPHDHIQTNNIQLTNIQSIPMEQSNIQHENHHIPKQMTDMNPMTASIPDRKYEIPSQYYPLLKKKRKVEEPGFYRPSIVDKRPIYENIPNDHSLVPDNYSTFDCNLPWQTPTISTGNAAVGKWWT